MAIKYFVEQLQLQQNTVAVGVEVKNPVDLKFLLEKLNILLELCIERDLILGFLALAQALVEEKSTIVQRLNAVPYILALKRVTMSIEFKLKWLKKLLEQAIDEDFANTMNEQMSQFCSTPFQPQHYQNVSLTNQSSVPFSFQIVWNSLIDDAENEKACHWLKRGTKTIKMLQMHQLIEQHVNRMLTDSQSYNNFASYNVPKCGRIFVYIF